MSKVYIYLILLILLIHLIHLIHLILLTILKNINNINSIIIPTVSTIFLDTLDLLLVGKSVYRVVYRRAAPVYAMPEYLLSGGILARSIKSAKFLAGSGRYFSGLWLQIRAIRVAIIYYYHNYRFQNTPKITIKPYLFDDNDLKLGLFETDNFSLVQGSSLIMPIMARLAMQENSTYFQQNAFYAV